MIGNISKSKGFKGDKGDPFTYEDLTDEQKAELLGGAKFADKEELESHKYNANNPHGVTKEQVGLSNVDNTSDKDKPISDAVKEELGNKVDKVDGKGLSSNDFTDNDKQKLDNTSETLNNKVDYSDVVPDYDEWFLNSSYGDDYFKKVPSMNVFSEFYESSATFLKDKNISVNIEEDLLDSNVMVERKVPNIQAVKDYINQKPITEIPTTLEPNKAYNFGIVDNLSLSFPTYANDGDVIYITFFAEADEGKLPNLVIDTTNTTDIELIPENSTGYEIFAKYNGNASAFGIDNYWIVNYSEFTL